MEGHRQELAGRISLLLELREARSQQKQATSPLDELTPVSGRSWKAWQPGSVIRRSANSYSSPKKQSSIT
jgi:hypothetical protein